MSKQPQQPQTPDDTAGYWIGMVLFSVLIPALFFVAVALSPT